MANIVEMPKLGFDMAEGTLVSWVKKEGEHIQKGDVLAEIETDKATIQVESTFGGTILKELLEANTTVPVGTPIAIIGETGEEVDLESLTTSEKNEEQAKPTGEINQEETVPEAPAKERDGSTRSIKASPLAKAMARDNKLDLTQVIGSGPAGRIVKRDVEQFIASHQLAGQRAATQVPSIQPGEDHLQPLSKLRKAIGSRMQRAKQSIPHFYVTYNYNVEFLLKMREQINKDRSKEERISVNDFIVKATALALRKFPKLNASMEGDALTLHGNINIGNAVAVDEGLLTVVCRNADQKSLLQISEEIREMVKRVRNGKVAPEDIEGSTFTISNLGMYGVEDFSAIINPPESAILAVSSAMQVPVVEDGAVRAGMRMKATISADHRISDGAEAALFMRELASYIEQPWLLW
ncbi:MAG: 2-oxo acid dehydrogenase subunit E2 [Chloroflexi bacterium]|nr:2-oxo acid dehydrogenase subunit E2 [Chloroflexota bacterium]